MEYIRSKGVTIFGGLIIATCLLSLFLILNPRPYLDMYIKPFGIVLYILGVIFTLLEIALGWNILKLKEWARKYLPELHANFIH